MRDKKDIKLLNRAEYYSSTEYPQFVEYAIKQQHSHWLFSDPGVENDLHSMLVDLSEAERHAIISVLKLFVHYELRLGSTFWAAIGNTFPRAEVQRMGAVFSAMEIGVHSPFYAEVNRLLNLDTPEFYLEYKENPVLRRRMDFLEENCKLGKKCSVIDYLVTLATFSMIEGVVLYSSFALLKSFQSNGHNKIPNIVTGVDYVCVDESIHAEGAAHLYSTLLHEAELTDDEQKDLTNRIKEIALITRDHEIEIIDMIFEKGKLPSITDVQMKHFIDSRTNLILSYLGEEKIFNVKYDPIGDWFYKNINAPTLTDFFNRASTQYSRDWNEDGLKWVTDK